MKTQNIQDVEVIESLIRQGDVEIIDLKFVDLAGQFRHVSIPARAFKRTLLTNGIGFDGSSVGFKSVKSGDMCLIPDLSTTFWDQFWDYPALSMFCNIVEADTRSEFIGDPRSIAIRAAQFIKEQNIADKVLIQPEFEFNIFDSVKFSSLPNHHFVELYSRETSWNPEQNSSPLSGYRIAHQGGYHSAAPGDSYRNIRVEICQALENVDIDVKYHHHEVGASGQQEIEFTMNSMVSACDNAMLLKYVVKNIVLNHGLSVTFMPKPIMGDAGNGLHIHLRLVDKDGKPLFYSDKDDIGLSDLAYCFIGGIIFHGSSLAAFTNPSTNSYRRLIPGFEAPTNLFFSLGSRNSAIRIPKYATSPDQKNFELRSPDATCNIYFAVAAMIMAGVDGVRRGMHARENNWGPFTSLEAIPSRKRRKIPAMPESLEQALQALHDDHEYLKAGNVFTQTLIDGWRISKMEREVLPLREYPTPLEFAMYYSC